MTLNPISSTDLSQRLKAGTVQFAFKKVNGDLRTAVGTTDLSLIPVENHPKGTGTPKPMIPFWDIEKKTWRAVSLTSEIFIS